MHANAIYLVYRRCSEAVTSAYMGNVKAALNVYSAVAWADIPSNAFLMAITFNDERLDTSLGDLSM